MIPTIPADTRCWCGHALFTHARKTDRVPCAVCSCRAFTLPAAAPRATVPAGDLAVELDALNPARHDSFAAFVQLASSVAVRAAYAFGDWPPTRP